MSYSNRQTRAFTQIAYMDLTDRMEYYQNAGLDKAPLSEILYPSEQEDLRNMGIPDEEFNNWSIRTVYDTNAKNGFYACVIETGKNEAVVAFRGSDARNGNDQYVQDWLISDIGLLNSELTVEQNETDRFLQQNKKLLSGYDNLMMTGHSLGGNLAEYATIVSDKYGLDDHITQCVSLDGPGFSDEFIREHEDRIREAGKNGRITHYRWSLVGGMLFDLEGVEYHYAEVSNEANHQDREQYETTEKRHIFYFKRA